MRRGLFGIDERETHPATRGFVVSDPAVEARLTRIGKTFVAGYHGALLDPRPEPLEETLAAVETGWRGFAAEGVGMALALVDFLTPGRSRRLAAFLDGPGRPHRYLVAVGAGWTLARVPRRVDPLLASLDDHLRWLVLDGYGFHHGYFGWRHSLERHRVPGRLAGYQRRAFDPGLGRSLWFVEGADPERIAKRIATFPPERHRDLWSGVGLACAYAGGLAPRGIGLLRDLAGPHAPDLAQGAAFAALARRDGEDPAPHTDGACSVLCGLKGAAAAELTARVEGELPAPGPYRRDDPDPLYERWRRRVRTALAGEDSP